MRTSARLITGAAAFAFVAALLVGCGAASGPPASTPSIRGVITSANGGATGGPRSIRIVWTADPVVGAKTEFDAAQASVTAQTRVLRATTSGYETIAPGVLKVGDVVQAWFTGAVLESYPVQVTASCVVVTGSYEGTLPVPPGLTPEPTP